MKTNDLLRRLPTAAVLLASLSTTLGATAEIKHRIMHTFNGENSGDQFGYAVYSGAGGGLMVGAPYADVDGDANTGQVYIFPSYTIPTWVHTVRGDSAGDLFGFSVDSGSKKIVGAPGDGAGGRVFQLEYSSGYTKIPLTDHGSSGENKGYDVAGGGRNYVFGNPGHDEPFDGNAGQATLRYEDQLLGLQGEQNFTGGDANFDAGTSVAYLASTSFAIGSPGDDLGSGATDTGSVTIIVSHNTNPYTISRTIDGSDTGERFGSAIDGISSGALIIGAPDNDDNGSNAGKAYLYGLLGSPLHEFEGASAGDNFGESVANAGDIDGDGSPDIMIASPNSGYVKIYSGNGYAEIWSADNQSSGFGRSMHSAGDINGDGLGDFVIGDPTGGANSGGYVNVYISQLVGDTDVDGDIDSADIDFLFDEVGTTPDTPFDPSDLDEDSDIDLDDVDELVITILDTNYGDGDLDGDIDNGDLQTQSSNFTGPSGTGKLWADGDTDGDGDIDNSDQQTAIANFTGPNPAPVPEPASLAILLLCGATLTRRRR